MTNTFRFLWMLWVIFCPYLGYSAEEPPAIPNFPLEETQQPAEAHDFMSEFIRMMIYLGIILTIIMIMSWYLKKMTSVRRESTNFGSHIKILETRQLSPRSMIHLIEFENVRILLSEAPTGVTKLAQLPRTSDFSTVMEKESGSER